MAWFYGASRYGEERQCLAWRGRARCGAAWHGSLCLISDCMNKQLLSFMLHGKARQGLARRGGAMPGTVGRGEVRLGKAR